MPTASNPMGDQHRRRILEEVAAGNLRPEDAARRLRDEPPARTADDPTGPPPSPDARRVIVQGTAGSVDIIGDASVRTVDVDGPHELSEEDGAIVIDCESVVAELHDETEFRGRGVVLLSGRTGRSRRFGVRRRERRTVVRVRPDLPVEVRVNAGAARIEGLRGDLHFDVAAGALRVEDHRGRVGGTVSAGSLRFDGTITGGDDEVRVEAGAVKIRLRSDSDVTVTASVTLGTVVFDGASDARELVVGAGRGRLAIVGSLSGVKVAVGD